MDLSKLSKEELRNIKRECNTIIKTKDMIDNDFALKLLEEKINNFKITDRVKSFYDNTDIVDILFLLRSLRFSKTDNYKGSLNLYELLSSNEEYKILLEEKNIKNYLDLLRKRNPDTGEIYDAKRLNEAINECSKISYLLTFFKDFNNIYYYQGSYNTFLYITNTLNRKLVDSNLSDIDIINKDYFEKAEYIKNHLKSIANYLYEYRDSLNGSRLSICNASLSKMVNKKGVAMTFSNEVFSSAISFGTTLDELLKDDYSSTKGLIYIPYKRTSK